MVESQVWIALIGAVSAIASAGIGAYNNELARRSLRHTAETKADVAEIKKQTNGMSKRIETLAGEKGVLEGHAQGLVDAGALTIMPAADSGKVQG